MPLPGVCLGLPDPVPQGLRMHVQLLAQPPERRPRGRLPIQPNRTLAQLVGVLPRCWQQSLPSWFSRSNQSSKTPENRGNLTSMWLAVVMLAVDLIAATQRPLLITRSARSSMNAGVRFAPSAERIGG